MQSHSDAQGYGDTVLGAIMLFGTSLEVLSLKQPCMEMALVNQNLATRPTAIALEIRTIYCQLHV